MADAYRGKIDDRRYTGNETTITYNLKRCIHAEECVHRLNAVFDNKRRPWIDPQAGSADQIASTVENCPSGALHYERHDGGTEETVPTSNRITIWHNGPLQISGDIQIDGTTVSIEQETRATLCRCGASKNKPFCDNAHLDIGFEAVEIEASNLTLNQTGGKLVITPHPNGPLQVSGECSIVNEAGEVLYSGTETWLCRCGGSSRKPFCDSTHRSNGFSAE